MSPVHRGKFERNLYKWEARKIRKSIQCSQEHDNKRRRIWVKTAIESNAQGDLMTDPDTVNHTSNGILDQKILIWRTIGELSVLPPSMNPRITMIVLTTQTLLTPEVQEIFVDTTLGKVWTNRTPRRISRTGVDGYITVSTPIHSRLSKTSNPYSIDNNGTRIFIGIRTTSNDPAVEAIWSPGVRDKRQPQISDIPINWTLPLMETSPIIFLRRPFYNDVVSEKISNRSSRYLCVCVWMHLAAYPINCMIQQFVDLGFSTV